MPFAFPFYGTAQTRAFVNSDGNITFGESDTRELRSQRVAVAHRPAARRAVLRRPRSVYGQRPRLPADRGRTRRRSRGAACAASTYRQTVTVQASSAAGRRRRSAVRDRHRLAQRGRRRSRPAAPASSSRSISARRAALAGGDAAVGERFSARIRHRSGGAVSKGSTRRIPTTTISWSSGRTSRSSAATRSPSSPRSPTRSAASASTSSTRRARLRQRRPPAQPRHDGHAGEVPGRARRRSSSARTTRSACMGQEAGHRWLAFLRFRDPQPAGIRGAARPRPGALELLHGLGRLGHGGQRHRGPGRRSVPHSGRRASATACSTSTRWGSSADSQVPDFFYVEIARRTCSHRGRREDEPDIGVTFNGTKRAC